MSLAKSQRGQASVEYVLMLALAIAIVLGAIYQLNTAFRFFSDNYFGSYLTCLLETGELPTLGGESAQGICAAEFKPFSLADGAPKVGDPIGAGGGAGSNNGEPDPSDVKGGTTSSNADSGDGSAFGPGGSRRGQRTRVKNAGKNKSGEDDDKSSSSASSSAFSAGYDYNKVTRTPVRYPSGYQGRRGSSGLKEEIRTKVKVAGSGGQSNEERGQSFKRRTRLLSAIEKEPVVDLGLGGFLRYLIIFIIIIAILVFIGGQALQVSKNS